jgi:hypothetical protein
MTDPSGFAEAGAAYNQGREDEKTVLLMWLRYWFPNSAKEIIRAVEENRHRGGEHLPYDVTLHFDGTSNV